MRILLDENMPFSFRLTKIPDFKTFPIFSATIDCLKRIASILLLLILVFNFCGYRLVIAYMNDTATAAVEKKADAADYADSDLVSVKTALNLPYYTGSKEFERAYGSITLNGQDYEYVKRRVCNDTLELLCLPNAAKEKLKAAGNDLARASADGNASTPTKKSSATVKISLPDFYQTLSLSLLSLSPSVTGRHFLLNDVSVIIGHPSLQERPPQVG